MMGNRIIEKAYRTILSRITVRIFYLFIIGNIVIGLFFFIQFHASGKTRISTFPEWFLWNINDMNQLLLIYSVFFLILSIIVCDSSKKHHLKLIKYKSIFDWVFYSIFSIIILSIGYVLILFFLCLFQSVGRMNFSFKWNTISINLLTDIYQTGKYHNLILLIINNCINLIFYFITLGLLVLFLVLLFKNVKVVGIIILCKLIVELANP